MICNFLNLLNTSSHERRRACVWMMARDSSAHCSTEIAECYLLCSMRGDDKRKTQSKKKFDQWHPTAGLAAPHPEHCVVLEINAERKFVFKHITMETLKPRSVLIKRFKVSNRELDFTEQQRHRGKKKCFSCMCASTFFISHGCINSPGDQTCVHCWCDFP